MEQEIHVTGVTLQASEGEKKKFTFESEQSDTGSDSEDVPLSAYKKERSQTPGE